MDLDEIAGALERMQESRDAILGGSRRVIGLCSRAIMSVHGGRVDEAARTIKEAGPLLEELRSRAHPRTAHHLIPAEQEYVEASALLAVVRGGEIPKRDKLGVMPESYILGLLDMVGELKRLMLDHMRAGRTGSALSVFDAMDGMYGELYRFAAYDKILKESRRKLDVCRMVLETSRSAITEERRRQDMVRAASGHDSGRPQTI
jgi:translin